MKPLEYLLQDLEVMGYANLNIRRTRRSRGVWEGRLIRPVRAIGEVEIHTAEGETMEEVLRELVGKAAAARAQRIAERENSEAV